MYRTTLAAGLLTSVLAATAASAADTPSQSFIKQAVQGNLAEISVGQLALQKATSDGVKQLGQALIEDHMKANQAATTAAQALGVTPPTAPTAEQTAMHDRLAGESGAAFEHDFVAGMVTDHEKDIADYQKASADKDAAGQYAGATLPDLKKHLSLAQQLAQNATASTAAAAPAKGPLVPGANSFTEGQARSRIERAGFQQVSALKKDAQGIWRGTAMKNGQSVQVGLDFKGNVAGL